MCLILLAYRCHPRYPLIVAANRDEFRARPTTALNFWPDAPQILGGRDEMGHGTWLGVTTRGRLAAVTNYREPGAAAGARSRGLLVSNFLRQFTPAENYLRNLDKSGSAYGGYNLLAGSREGLYCQSNRGAKTTRVNPGVHGLSNRLLNTPWPKIRRGRAALESILKTEAISDPEALFALLGDRTIAPDDQLPDTGVDRAWERQVSPLFIAGRTYGTRSSALLYIEHGGRVRFMERTFEEQAGEIVATATRRFTFFSGTR